MQGTNQRAIERHDAELDPEDDFHRCTGCGMDVDSCRYSRDHSNDLGCCPECSHS